MPGARGPRRLVLLAFTLATLAAPACGGEESAITGRLDALVEEVNRTIPEGLATITHAAQVGGFFTTDVTIDLGEGTAPIHGRETLMGMVARLQPRTAAYRVAIDDMSVQLLEGEAEADVVLTASFISRRTSQEGEIAEARELALRMTKRDGTWRIERITAVPTLR